MFKKSLKNSKFFPKFIIMSIHESIQSVESYYNEEPQVGYLENFREIHLSNEKLSKTDFNYITKYITNSKTILNTKNFLLSINNFSNNNIKNPRILLTTYLISFHTKTILTIEEDEDIFELSNMLLFHLNTFLGNISQPHFNNLNKCLIDFYTLFDKWKSKDKNRFIHILAKSYWDIESNMIFKLQNNDLNDINKELWLECAKDEQNTIIKRVLELGGEDALEYFNSLIPVMVNESVVNNVEEIVKNVFWDNFKDELSKEPPNYLSIIPMLKDTSNLLKSCIPNRHDIHKDIDEHIDIDFIKQMIEHNAIDNKIIIDLIKYITGMIMKLDCISNDKDNIKWTKTLIKNINDGMTYKEFFPDFFRELFLKLDEINEYATIIRNSLKESEEEDNDKSD